MHPRSGLLVLLVALLALTGCTFGWDAADLAEPSLSAVAQGDVPAGTLQPVAATAALAVAEKDRLENDERAAGTARAAW